MKTNCGVWTLVPHHLEIVLVARVGSLPSAIHKGPEPVENDMREAYPVQTLRAEQFGECPVYFRASGYGYCIRISTTS